MSRSLNGTSDYISLANIASVGDFTVLLWFYIVAVDTATARCIFAWDNYPTSPRNDLIVQAYNGGAGGWNYDFEVGDTGSSFNNASQFSTGTWHSLIVTRSGTTGKLYVDGTRLHADVTLGSGTFTASNIRIGEHFYSGADHEFSNIRAGEFAMWNVALGSTDRASLDAGRLPSTVQNGSLTQYIPLWGISSPEPTMVSGGLTGTLTGTTQAATHSPVDLYVVQVSAKATTASATSKAVSLAATPTVNNTAIVRGWGKNAALDMTTPTVTDNQTPANTYTLAWFKQDATNGEWAGEWYAKATTASSTFTATLSYTGTAGPIDVEISEVYPTLYLDQQSSTTGSSTSPAPGSKTTVQAPELCTTVVSSNGSATETVPSGYVIGSSDLNVNSAGATAYKTVGVTGAQNPTWTTTNVGWACGQATYSIITPLMAQACL